MKFQFIHDSKGKTTGVFIPIEDWQMLKSKYADLQKEETADTTELLPWQKNLLDKRLKDYYDNPDIVSDFDETIDDIEKGL